MRDGRFAICGAVLAERWARPAMAHCGFLGSTPPPQARDQDSYPDNRFIDQDVLASTRVEQRVAVVAGVSMIKVSTPSVSMPINIAGHSSAATA